jgi:enoyl-CoA hydratase/carnithine racemase
MAKFESYQNAFKNIKMERRDGILQLNVHYKNGPALWSFRDENDLHAELGEAFYKIGRDYDNRVVIITGTGGQWMAGFGDQFESEITQFHWERLRREGVDLLMNLLDIEALVIGVVEGAAHIHAEIPTMSDYVIASEDASFADKAHAPGGVVPGDGVHTWWPMLLGPNRGRAFLMSGQEISAQEGKQLGFVAEVLPKGKALDRAWEVAREWAAKPPLMIRYTRLAFTQPIKERMLKELNWGLVLENTANSRFGAP